MTEILSIGLLAAAFALLCALSWIDLKKGILPDELVLCLLIAGAAFHYVTHFTFEAPEGMAWGALMGGGMLYAVRIFANYVYKQDALGLGDVKLLIAGGVWLGAQDVLVAIIAGAAAGIFHGLIAALLESRKTKTKMDLKTFSLPAGPGFAIGIIIAAILKFRELPEILMS